MNVSRYDSWERESLLHSLSPLTPAWNNFLLLNKSLLGIPHGRSRRTWTYAQTYPIPGDIKKEKEEIAISLIVFERRLRPSSGQLNLCNEVEIDQVCTTVNEIC